MSRSTRDGPHDGRVIVLRPKEAHCSGLRCGEQVGHEGAGEHQPVQQDRDLVLGAAGDAAILSAIASMIESRWVTAQLRARAISFGVCEDAGDIWDTNLNSMQSMLAAECNSITRTAGTGGEKLAEQVASQQTCPEGHFVSVLSS